ncbi:MAG: sulfite exporter TauE/SafE family protein [bacterium]|nr:sulfite exporter TauE/SafE family protein [bacterium]
MEFSTLALLAAAGFAGGFINAAVGSGTLIVYPALVAAGLAPVSANGTNTAGLSPGNFAAAWAYRRELRERLTELRKPLIAAVIGAAIGAVLVVSLPSKVFTSIVPWLVASATVLVAVQPLMVRWLRSRPQVERRALWPWSGAVGVYGGYFGAAQGVMLMAVLGLVYDSDTQRSNAAKNILAATANLTAAVVFAVSGAVVWLAALAVAIGSVPGGYVGGRVSRLLPNYVLRALVVLVGVGATVYLVVSR